MSLRNLKKVVSQGLGLGHAEDDYSLVHHGDDGMSAEQGLATVIELEDFSPEHEAGFSPLSPFSSSSLSSAEDSSTETSGSSSSSNVQTFRTFARMLTKSDIDRVLGSSEQADHPIILVDADGVPITPHASVAAFKTSDQNQKKKSRLAAQSSVSTTSSHGGGEGGSESGKGKSGKKKGSKSASKKKQSSLLRSSLAYPPENPFFHRIQTFIVHGLQILINVIFAGFAIAGKFAFAEVNPLIVLALRYNMSVPFMLLAVFVVDGPIRLTPKQFVKLSVLGLFGVFMSQVFFFLGLDFASATSATILQLIVPPITATVSILMKREKGSIIKAAGLGASLLGAFIIIGVDGLNFSIPSLLGDGFVIISSIFASFYFLFQQNLIEEMPAFTVSVVAFSSAAAFSVLSTVWFVDDWKTLPHLSLRADASILYIGLAGTTFAYLMLPWCQQRSSLLATSCYITIQPMIAALLSWMILGDDLGLTLLVGGVFIIIGLGLVAYSRYREEHELHFKINNAPPIVPTTGADDLAPAPSFDTSRTSSFSRSSEKIVEVNLNNVESIAPDSGAAPKRAFSHSLEMANEPSL